MNAVRGWVTNVYNNSDWGRPRSGPFEPVTRV